MKDNKFLIIDSHALLHRGYHALPPLKTKEGKLVNAVYGFSSAFLKSLRDFFPKYVIATFDSPGPTFRHKKFKKYKAQRPVQPQEFYQQIPLVKKVLKVFGVPIFEKAGFEADDLIGTIVEKISRSQSFPQPEIIILSGDLDLLQLVDQKVKTCIISRGIKEMKLYDIEKVKEKYDGLKPCQLADFRGLKGDPSDNIPGLPGIGKKKAIKLIKKFGSLENLYRKIKEESPDKTLQQIVNFKEEALFFKEITTIKRNIELDFKLKETDFLSRYDKEKIMAIFKELNFETLIKRLEKVERELGLGNTLNL